jgi:hypothetical protein
MPSNYSCPRLLLFLSSVLEDIARESTPKMRDIRDPDTGEVIETVTDDEWAECLQEALRRRLLAFTGRRNRDGKAIYMRLGQKN